MTRFACLPMIALVVVALGGCSSDAHHHGDHSEFETVFSLDSSDPEGVICCPHETVTISLELLNLGPYHDHYLTRHGRTHRIEVVDHHGHVVWDSWLHETRLATGTVFDMEAGDHLEFVTVWDVVDDHGFGLPAGTYKVHATYSGELEHFGRLDAPPPLVIDVITVIAG